ncbi:MAG: ABC transporter ATP-binding protein [Chloroflexota bacterium]|nr:MAG: ABC transporter ATP-binding protein [Chloroflexota bacterium]
MPPSAFKSNDRTPASSSLIHACGLCKTYRRSQVQVEALRGVNLEIPKGAFVVIAGPSGSGKTTLLHLLGGIDRPTAGQLCIDGYALEHARETELTRFRRDRIGFIFQFYNLLPSLNALDNVILPLLARGWSWKKAGPRGQAVLRQVGLQGRAHHKPGELSGGEQQRVAIARALVVEPALVLADEPTGDLDSITASGVIQLMVSLNRQLGVTFVIATHNLEICQFATHTYEMRDGKLAPGPLKP